MRILDLYCGGGGCSCGYYRAGFECVGVDINPQPNYPYKFIRADAIEYLTKHGKDFDVIHASPPCQRFTRAQRLQKRRHADLLTPTVKAIKSVGVPWVVENVPGAPLVGAVTLCGLSLGCGVKRHRLFLSSMPLMGTPCPKSHAGEWFTVFGGGAAKDKRDGRRRATATEAKRAMGIDWMTRRELSQSVPPAYTEYIGRQIMTQLDRSSFGHKL